MMRYMFFLHFLHHFFRDGVGLSQICDWCRLMWMYRGKLKLGLLESRIKTMGLTSEWKAFAALSVRDLGMPVEAVPMYSSDSKWSNKTDRLRKIILETGNFGHNRGNSHYHKHSYLVYKAISFGRNTKDSFRHMMIFPKDETRIFLLRLWEGIRVASKGK